MDKLNVLMLEDELTTGHTIARYVSEHSHVAQVHGPLVSVNEAISWLNDHESPDLILADIELGDGLSFELFEELELKVPIIFITAYDQYLLKAFEVNSVDYLLKPTNRERVFKALDKFVESTAGSFDIRSLLSEINWKRPQYKQRFLVKKGIKSVVIIAQDIAYIEKDDFVYLVTQDDRRLIINYTLEELNGLLDPASFFRISRQAIVHIDHVAELQPNANNLTISLRKQPGKMLLVSQRNIPAFRKWLEA